MLAISVDEFQNKDRRFAGAITLKMAPAKCPVRAAPHPPLWKALSQSHKQEIAFLWKFCTQVVCRRPPDCHIAFNFTENYSATKFKSKGNFSCLCSNSMSFTMYKI